MKRHTNRWTRRGVLAGLGAGALWTGGLMQPFMRAWADGPAAPPLLIVAYFKGGWDTLLCLDPRDDGDFFAPHRGNTPPPNRAIETNYGQIRTPAFRSLYQTTEAREAGRFSGLVQPEGSNIVFGPAIGELRHHFADLCVVRGINTNTAAHEVGMRYFLTGRFPAGSAGAGNSLTTYVAGSHLQGAYVVPNLSMGIPETYNADLDPRASALRVDRADALAPILAPQHRLQAPRSRTQQAIDVYQTQRNCLHDSLDVNGSVRAYRAAHAQTRPLMTGQLYESLRLGSNPAPGSPVARAYETIWGIPDPTPFFGSALGDGGELFFATLAAVALTQNVTQVVELQLTQNIDHHFGSGWENEHAGALIAGFDALARLWTYLGQTEDPRCPGRSLKERTSMFVFSEFARRQYFNRGGGRDHHLTSAALVAGPGIQGNLVVGATDDVDYRGYPVNFRTGEIVDGDGGRIIAPYDLHATIAASMDLDYDPQLDRNLDSPQVLEPMLS